MAKEQEFNGEKVSNDLVEKLDLGFSGVIREIHKELSKKWNEETEGSPVYTGFLASSWKVRRKPILQTQSVYNL